MLEKASEPRRVLVTGSTGAIGEPVCEWLMERGHYVRGFARRPSPVTNDYVQGDLGDREKVRGAVAGVDTVIHLGAYPNPADFVDVLLQPNVIGLYHICEAAKDLGVVRLVLASTMQTVTGHGWPQRPIRVAEGPTPVNYYALTKVWAEEAGAMLARNHDLSVISVRIGWLPRNAETGRDGGYALLDSYRTSLTGLREGEIRALFMLSIPAPLAELGLSQDLRSALLKLSASLPHARRGDPAWVRQRFHLDATWWHQREEPVPHLQTIHQSVWQDRRLHIAYRLPFAIEIQQTVDPYGLVAKAGVWYLVCCQRGTLRVHRVSDLLDARGVEETFVRPQDFDLVNFWHRWCLEREKSQTRYLVRLRVALDFVPMLPFYFGHGVRRRIEAAESLENGGGILLDFAFESLEAARDRVLGFGRGVEVLSPLALRASVADYAAQILSLYDEGPHPHT